MEKTDYYPIIFKRKSVRNYDLTPLDEDTLAEISKHLDNLKPMYDNIKTEIKIISSSEVESRKMKKSFHYIAVFSETNGDYLTNVGFMLQQMDLYPFCWRYWLLLARISNAKKRSAGKFRSGIYHFIGLWKTQRTPAQKSFRI